jgi:hypothetical protein
MSPQGEKKKSCDDEEDASENNHGSKKYASPPGGIKRCGRLTAITNGLPSSAGIGDFRSSALRAP